MSLQQILMATGGSGTPFSPSDIAGLVLWLKADAIVGLNNGDPIDTWVDSSSAATDATASGATRPTYQTNQINSLPIVRFDGSDDYFTIIKGAYAAWSVFFVIKSNNTSFAYLLSAGTDATALLVGLDVDKWQFYNNPAIYDIGIRSTVAFQNIHTVQGQAGNSGTWLLGKAVGGAPIAADLAEIIVYDSSLSGGDVTSVSGYISSKYGI